MENKQRGNIRLEVASYKAMQVSANYHYSKSFPNNSFGYSVFENDIFCGCILFALGANKSIGRPYGLIKGQVCELVRVALNGKQFNVSTCLSRALKLLAKQNPTIQLVVSYADLDQDHAGTIYQATNWIYEGCFNIGMGRAFIVKGKKLHNKTIHSKGISQTIAEVKKHLDPNATIHITKGKHKYLYPLTKQMRKQIEPLAKPYPKRNGEPFTPTPLPF